MSLRRSLECALITFLLVGSAAHNAWAGPPADLIRVQIDRVIVVLSDPALKAPGREPQRHAAVRTIAVEIFDLPEMTRRTLGQHWHARTETEHAEFVRLFSDVLERGYFTKLATYDGERVTVTGDAIQGDQATVRSRITTRQGTEIPVDYRKIIQTSSYQALVDKLRTKRG